ncbi:MAG: HigA family addiction module antidote protein [Candidatus Rokubacteria bacterium]|nr:HigA family addiction module antidote protein [Candidatus Rokubacteria bacterium]
MPTTSRSSTTTRRRNPSSKRLSPTLPGEILRDEFLGPLKISQYQLAKEISVPRRRINEIVQGKRAITADTAIRLARYFGVSERFWLNVQSRYDIEITKDSLGNRLAEEVQERFRYRLGGSHGKDRTARHPRG